MSAGSDVPPVVRDRVHGAAAERWGGWSWREPAAGEHFRTCDYCGSIHPEDLAAEAEWVAEWADQKYGWPHKFYAQVPNRDPERLFVVSTVHADCQPGAMPGAVWIRGSELPEGVCLDGWRDLSDAWVRVGKRPRHHAKFYSVHLADPLLPELARDRIQALSGMRFEFVDGRVSWTPAP